MDDVSQAIKRADREGWATYMPTPAVLGSGVLAALAVMLSPFVLFAVVAIVAVVGELVRQGWVSLYGTVYVNMRSFVFYIQLEWPYILAGTALGLPLAYLRQRHGFYLRHVRGNQYRYRSEQHADAEGSEPEAGGELAPGGYRRRWMLPIYPHKLVLYLAGPLMLLGMAHHADPNKYPEILYNLFAVWFTSGVLAQLVWERLQVAILQLMARRIGGPSRSLSAEYQLKRLIEEDPALSYYSIWEVEVDVQSHHAKVYGNVRGDGAMRRLKELAAFIEGVESVEVVRTEYVTERTRRASGRST